MRQAVVLTFQNLRYFFDSCLPILDKGLRLLDKDFLAVLASNRSTGPRCSGFAHREKGCADITRFSNSPGFDGISRFPLRTGCALQINICAVFTRLPIPTWGNRALVCLLLLVLTTSSGFGATPLPACACCLFP